MGAHLLHGHTRYKGRKAMSPTYTTWVSMKRRCDVPSTDAYPDYGGRGILFCDEWHDFGAFLRDMGERPEGTTLDRIDPERGYSKENCRWATPAQQARNKRNSRKVMWEGVETPLMDLAEQSGIAYCTLFRRLKAGWPVHRLLEQVHGKA